MLMNFSERGGEAAVGADSSRSSRDCQIHLLMRIIASTADDVLLKMNWGKGWRADQSAVGAMNRPP
jgi:hypothetical protein